MAQEKTPGVYIQEVNAFPNSVVEVATAVPAFLGYTAKAASGQADLTGKTIRLSSMAEFEQYFGGAPPLRYDYAGPLADASFAPGGDRRFILWQSMRHFFLNGGGACYVVSLGGYGAPDAPTEMRAAAFLDGLRALENEEEPTLLVAPDAVLLDRDGWSKVANACLAQAVTIGDRMAILDVFQGDQPRDGPAGDVIQAFRQAIESDRPGFGAAYYPWLDTTVVAAADVSYLDLNLASRRRLKADLAAGLAATVDPKLAAKNRAAVLAQHEQLLAPLDAAEAASAQMTAQDRAAAAGLQQTLLQIVPDYRAAMARLLAAINRLPPAAAMAGVYARTDAAVGVWRAPANTGVAGVVSPAVPILSAAQADLNAPLDGKAVNAIRNFQGRGVLVWGARTLDGNSDDWRYVNVRRTVIMLEQSIRLAIQSYVFEPNTAATWAAVKSMIDNFLSDQWKVGALAGAKAADAYVVSVGLGVTMTPADIVDGVMRVSVLVAVTRPAEYIALTFQQLMQKA